MLRKLRWLLLIVAVLATLVAIFVRRNPLIFNESLWGHAHCIKIAGLQLGGFAQEHGGKFPYDPKGYGNALVLLDPDIYFSLTGPGYDATPFHAAKRNGTELSDEDCGRVYVQGLTVKSNAEIALLFDKIPTPGGDHCHFPHRLWAPLGREVWLVGTGSPFVTETEWPEFAKRQIEMLVNEGFEREKAEQLYARQPNH